jgi:hypothetical protein
MHTSTRLAAADFSFLQRIHADQHPLTFAEFCPGYHELDRVGVVSLCVEDGVLHTGRALLALTTAFYDCQRARGSDFFDYPQHFAFVGGDEAGLRTHSGATLPDAPHQWDAWSWLDVWPAHKWAATPPTATAMLERVFDYQINRLFWPHGLRPAAGEEPLPDYAQKMLRTRLKAVYCYSAAISPEHEGPVVEVRLSPPAETLLQESVGRLPPSRRPPVSEATAATDRFRLLDSAQFLASMG